MLLDSIVVIIWDKYRGIFLWLVVTNPLVGKAGTINRPRLRGLGEALERVLFQISFGYGESITDRRSCYFGISRQDRARENKRTSVSTRIGNR
jgi:hypothetical protein